MVSKRCLMPNPMTKNRSLGTRLVVFWREHMAGTTMEAPYEDGMYEFTSNVEPYVTYVAVQ